MGNGSQQALTAILQEYRKLDVPWGSLKVDERVARSTDYNFLVARERDAMAVFVKKYPKSTAVDVSQRVDRTGL
jgi:hypothetical protein